MKDLKHLIYFENLLMDADNELVREAQASGRVCVGSVCYQIPEVLMNLGNAFTVRLRAPRTGSMEMGTYYLTSFLCEYSRALLERAIEGGYQFLDCLIAPDGCTMIKLIEDSGAYVCADRFCFGSLPGREEIILNDEEDVLTQICRHYMMTCMCPRHMDTPKMNRRREYVDEIAKEYKADGIIYEQMKFCDPWAYERMVGSHVLRDEYGYPVLTIDRPYAVGNSGQIRTRVQAFVESIEIKKIQGGKH